LKNLWFIKLSWSQTKNGSHNIEEEPFRCRQIPCWIRFCLEPWKTRKFYPTSLRVYNGCIKFKSFIVVPFTADCTTYKIHSLWGMIVIIIIVSKRKSGFIQFQSFSSSSEKRYHNSYQLPPKQKLHSCLVKTKLITAITQHILETHRKGLRKKVLLFQLSDKVHYILVVCILHIHHYYLNNSRTVWYVFYTDKMFYPRNISRIFIFQLYITKYCIPIMFCFVVSTFCV